MSTMGYFRTMDNLGKERLLIFKVRYDYLLPFMFGNSPKAIENIVLKFSGILHYNCNIIPSINEDFPIGPFQQILKLIQNIWYRGAKTICSLLSFCCMNSYCIFWFSTWVRF